MDNVVTLITYDHDTFKWFCDKLEDDEATPGQIADLLERLSHLLIPHSKAEEDVVYPAISKAVPKEDAEVKDGAAEHHHIEDMLAKMIAEPADEPGVDGMVAALVAELRHHMEEEEEDILPEYESAADAAELDEVGRAFRQSKEDVRVAHGFPFVRRPDLDDLTRDQLYDRAQVADLDGRSEMSKGQLLDALKQT